MLHVLALTLLVAGAVAGGAENSHAQNYPSRPIRLVTAEAGGGADLTARLIGQEIAKSLGQPLIVDNRGGSAVIAAQVVTKAVPDGYTLLLYGGTVWVGPLLERAPYDPVRDLAPITQVVTTPNILVVHPAIPVTSVKELIALGKSRPGELNYAAGSTGSMSHLAGELFRTMAGIDIVRIPYKGTGPAVNALIGGQVQLMLPIAASALPHVKSGKLKALAVTSAKPSRLAPDLPTVAAAGLPGYEASAPFSAFAPAGTPAAVINLLNREIARALGNAEMRERLLGMGVEPVGNSPAEFAAFIKSDMSKWSKLIKDAGIRME
jgi:tripartite-type tricarboxylate transporter receptor subunit TctC